MNLHDPVAFRTGGDISFGIISEIVERENKDGKRLEIEVEMMLYPGMKEAPKRHPDEKEITDLTYTTGVYGDLGKLVASSPEYIWAKAESERRKNPVIVVEPPADAPTQIKKPEDVPF